MKSVQFATDHFKGFQPAASCQIDKNGSKAILPNPVSGVHCILLQSEKAF